MFLATLEATVLTCMIEAVVHPNLCCGLAVGHGSPVENHWSRAPLIAFTQWSIAHDRCFKQTILFGSSDCR